jgi:hypothetical protein
MKFEIKDVVIETLPRARKGKGEGEFAPDPSLCGPTTTCATTSSTCWCTCSGCTTLTHPRVKNYETKLSRYRDLESRLLKAVEELRRRQTFLSAHTARLKREKRKRAR